MGDWDKPAPNPVYVIGFGLLGEFGTLTTHHWLAAGLIFAGVFLYVCLWCIVSIVRHGDWIYWSTDNWFEHNFKKRMKSFTKPNDYQACLDSIAELEAWHAHYTVEDALAGLKPLRSSGSRRDGFAAAGRELMLGADTGKPVRC